MKIFGAVLAMLALVGCGTETQQEEVATQDTQQEVAPATTAVELPNLIIARVPVDAEGNELVDQMETRAVTVDAASYDAAAAQTVFADAQTVSVANELDQDTSTASYHSRSSYYWNTPWYPGKLLGRGLLWGRNPYTYYGGYRYNYRSYGNYYNYGRYNYYSYCRW